MKTQTYLRKYDLTYVSVHTGHLQGVCTVAAANKGKEVKDKATPLQAWTGPEGSRRLRLPDFKIVGT